jgi:arylsulfatase A-like enzyme
MNWTRRNWLSACAGTAGLQAQQRRPNIVFLFSDDHHYQCWGAAGNPHIHAPNMDRLASRGVHFVSGTISTPQCAPSRGILLSGLETYQSGLRSNGATSFRPDLGPTVIEQMRRSGYDTVAVGKWHIRNTPAECGFARAPLWLPGGGSRYVDPVLRRGLDGKSETVPGHITDLLTTAATDYLALARQPFFLWLAYNAPHTPWFASDDYRRRYAGKNNATIAPPVHPKNASDFDWITYYSVITHLDEAMGRVVAALEKNGLWDNTVVFFLGDNGFLCGTKGLNGKVYPWEESVRVPLAAAGGVVRRGLRVEDPVASIDLPATWLDLAGLKPAYPLAGRSLAPVLTTGKGGPQEAFATWDDPRPEALAVRRAVEPYRLVRTRRHKLIVWQSRKQALYDLDADAAEDRNLIEEPRYAEVRADLRGRLAARMASTNDPARAWLQ